MTENTPIRELCREFHLTQRALADRFGIPLRTVEDWSTGKHKCPDYVVRMIYTILENDGKADPQNPIEHDKHYYKCPHCNEDLEVSDDDIYVYCMTPPNHCKFCGQALKWPTQNNGQSED